MENNKEPLLKKVYYENCPGCKLDLRKEMHRGYPLKEFFFVWVVVLCNALPISSLFPFLYFMIRDFHVAKSVEDIGYYAGYVGSSFMIGRALTSVMWGIVADKYGRKPVIIAGTVSVVIFNTLFGLSSNFWMAIIVRFLLGCFNGVLGPIKAYISEVCRKEYQALGFSVLSTAWGIGLIIGPSLGGFLAQPAEKYPNVFSKESLFGRFPYFLPCLCISLFSMCVCVCCFWLPETLHMHGKTDKESDLYDILEGSQNDYPIGDVKEKEPVYSENLLKNWPLISSIIVYCVFSLHDMAYQEVFSLWAVSDRKYGGLGFPSNGVGTVLAITGFGLLMYQLFLYPTIQRSFGSILVSRFAAIVSIPVLASYPYMCLLRGTSLYLAVNCASLLKNSLGVTIITGLFVLQNNAVSQHQRGAANGIAMTGMSFCKAIGPASAGAVFAWGQKRLDSSFLPGDLMVFFLLNIVTAIGVILTFKPFLAQREVEN